MKTPSNRRGFLIQIGKVTGLALVAPVLAQLGSTKVLAREGRGSAPAAPAAGGDKTSLPLVKAGEGAAQALHYTTDKKTVTDKDLKIERTGVPFDKQNCAGCGFYTKAGKKDGKEVGECKLFANQLVLSNAWCASWNKKG